MALDRAPANPLQAMALVNRDGTLSDDGFTFQEEMWRQIVAGFVVVPCQATTASNVISLRPILHREGAATYADHMVFAFVADATTSGAVTAKVTDGQKDLGTLKVYINGGATQAGSGDIVEDRLYFAAYNAALDTAAGGLVLLGVLTSAGIVGFAEDVADTVGAMVTGNTETGITVTYQDAGNTLDFEVAFATAADQETGTSAVTAVSPSVQHRHQSAAKAWAIFDVTGGFVGYNITSVTDNGAGNWTVVIATDFSSGSWSANAFCGTAGAGSTPLICNTGGTAAGTCSVITWTAAGVLTDPTDPALVFFQGFGDQ